MKAMLHKQECTYTDYTALSYVWLWQYNKVMATELTLDGCEFILSFTPVCLHGFTPLEKTTKPRGNPHKHRENMNQWCLSKVDVFMYILVSTLCLMPDTDWFAVVIVCNSLRLHL